MKYTQNWEDVGQRGKSRGMEKDVSRPLNSQSDHRLRTVLPAREAGHSYYLPKGRQTLLLDSIKTVH